MKLLTRVELEGQKTYRAVPLSIFVTVCIFLGGVIASMASYERGAENERSAIAKRLLDQESAELRAVIEPVVVRLTALEASQARQDAALTSLSNQVYVNTGIIQSIQSGRAVGR